MALIKEQTLDNGVVVNYHRVVHIDSFPNVQTSIEVASYCSETGRETELAALNGETEEGTSAPYIYSRWYVTDYVDGMTASDAYAYLLTQSEFEGATSDEES